MGKVFRADYKVTGNKIIQVAVKFISGDISIEDRKQFYKEARFTQDILHTNVIKLVGVNFQTSSCFFAMEYINSSNLQQYLQKNYSDSENQLALRFDSVKLLKFCIQAASGLTYLYSNKYIHGDIAARNVFVNSDGVLKLSIFGLTRILHQSKVILIRCPRIYTYLNLLNTWCIMIINIFKLL